MLSMDKGTRGGSRRWNSCSWSSGVESRIEELEKWVKAIRQRRN